MLVTAPTCIGTIGGGRLEWDAIARARELARAGAAAPKRPSSYRWAPRSANAAAATSRSGWRGRAPPCSPRIEAEEQAASASLPRVLLFGAGHVGKALAAALAPLPLRLQLDRRPGRTSSRPSRPRRRVHADHHQPLLDPVAEAPPGSAYLVLTHSTPGFPICERGPPRARLRLSRPDRLAPPSAAVRARLPAHGGARALARMACPIGGPLCSATSGRP